MDGINIREMLPGEEKEVIKVGRRAFTWLESLWIPKPKQALVAIKDGKIAGAILIKYLKANGRTTGYYDYAFVDRKYHGMGIGSALYKATADYLWDHGCDSLSAAVKDDNIGSWGLLQKNGFMRISIPELVRQFGCIGAAKHYFATPFSICFGMDYYVASKDKSFQAKGGTLKQISAYIIANLFLSVSFLYQRTGHMGMFLTAYLSLLVLLMTASYLGTRFSRREWEYRLVIGGAVVTALVNLSTVFPLIGNWYPLKYEKTKEFRRDMGIAALAEWVLLMIITLITIISKTDNLLIRYLGQISAVFLVYRLIPIYPFESFGGRRLYAWNKPLYLAIAAATIIILIAGSLLGH